MAAAYIDAERVTNRHLGPTAPRAVAPAVVAPALAPLALAGPTPAAKAPGGFFGIWGNLRSWSSLLFFFVSFGTAIAYFTWITVGLSLSIGLVPVFLIGIPLFVLVMGSVRGLILFEGMIVENLLGVRMPRRKPWVEKQEGILATAKFWITDGHTWKSLLYLLLQFPVAITLFGIFVALTATSFAFIMAPIQRLIFGDEFGRFIHIGGREEFFFSGGGLVLMFAVGVLLMTATLHMAHYLGTIYGQVVKSICVHRTTAAMEEAAAGAQLAPLVAPQAAPMAQHDAPIPEPPAGPDGDPPNPPGEG